MQGEGRLTEEPEVKFSIIKKDIYSSSGWLLLKSSDHSSSRIMFFKIFSTFETNSGKSGSNKQVCIKLEDLFSSAVRFVW